MLNRWLAIGSFLMALSILTGAFGAHGLKDVLDAYGHEVYHKAFFYHLVHALGIILVVILANEKLVSEQSVKKILPFFLLGIFLFSGSLYTLALTGMKWLGAITPFGGTAFILGWIWLGASALKQSKVK